ncbi:hypothetical protein ACHAWU_004574 [Discostella pseudostelligera]|uniref:Uncharacterized protein n=1 Tax=Discostella pseudostelligera TaxID=259834 RepID=A0ABD3MJZ0_9STRA
MTDQMPAENTSPQVQDEVAASGSASSSTTTTTSTSSNNNKSSNDPLLESIKQCVSITNSTLAIFEEATYHTSSSFVSRLRELAKQGRYIATRANAYYEQRGQYGALAVAGSAAVVGGVVALRMGKAPGAVAASVAGAAAYGNIYGYEDYSATSWRRSVPKKE